MLLHWRLATTEGHQFVIILVSKYSGQQISSNIFFIDPKGHEQLLNCSYHCCGKVDIQISATEVTWPTESSCKCIRTKKSQCNDLKS